MSRSTLAVPRLTMTDPVRCLWRAGLLLLLAACTSNRDNGNGMGTMPPPPSGKVVAPPVNGPGADGDTPGQFTGPPGGPAPKIVYPFDQTMLARNINQMRLAFSADPTQKFFRIVLDSPSYQQTLYLGAAACQGTECSYLVDDKVWAAIAHGSTSSTMTVFATAGAGKPVGSAALTLSFSPADVRGGLYYFSTSRYGLMRLPFGGTTAVPFLTGTGDSSDGVKYCVGCHGISRDGKKVAALFKWPDGYAGIVDGADPTKYLLQPTDAGGDSIWNFASFSPDGSKLITVWDGGLSLRDGSNGKLIKNVKGSLLGGQATMPEWSPDGNSIVFVRLPLSGRLGSQFPSSTFAAGDWIVGDAGDIAVLPYNNGDFGQAVIIVPSTPTEFHFYPSFSPDSQWIVFNSTRSPGCASDTAASVTGLDLKAVHCVSYDQTTARLRLVRAMPNQTPIELTAATHLPSMTTAWPKFAPFQQGNLVFFTFSSKFDYGFVVKQADVRAKEGTARPQIWMAAIDLSKAVPGETPVDPSFPPFWLPFQDAMDNNHEVLWTQDVACIKPSDCGGSEFTCTGGVCVPIPG